MGRDASANRIQKTLREGDCQITGLLRNCRPVDLHAWCRRIRRTQFRRVSGCKPLGNTTNEPSDETHNEGNKRPPPARIEIMQSLRRHPQPRHKTYCVGQELVAGRERYRRLDDHQTNIREQKRPPSHSARKQRHQSTPKPTSSAQPHTKGNVRDGPTPSLLLIFKRPSLAADRSFALARRDWRKLAEI